MEYHFVVKWSEKDGWVIDWPTTMAKFDDGATVYHPMLNEWLLPVPDSETQEQEDKLYKELTNILNAANLSI